MKKLTCILSILSLFFILPSSSFGQRVKPLKNSSSFKTRDIFIQLKHIDSIKQTIVYLINLSEKDHEFYGQDTWMNISTQAKDANGKWSKITSKPPLDCGTGLGFFSIPNNHYTSVREYYLEGDFETEMRYSITLKDSTIYSKPFAAKIPVYSFMGHNFYTIKKIKEYLQNENLTNKQKINYHYREAAVYARKIKDYEKAISSCEKALLDFPKSEKLHFLLGQIYLLKLNHLRKTSDITEEEKIIIFSAGFKEFEIANELANSKDESIKKLLKKYDSGFPSKLNWNTNNELDCIEVDGKLKCFEKYFLKDYIEIKFRN